ncbi:MAG: exo-alpha-sialidase [Phycisphaerae bacterium]|nr:exo-alpha-sialidase [Phycisphaerae bacterium]
MRTYPANEARTATVFTVSNCNASAPIHEDPRGNYGITPHCKNSYGLFATSNHTCKGLLFRSTNGQTAWTQVHDFGYASSYDCDALHATSTGTLLAWVDEGAGHVVYRGTASGVTFTKATNTVGGGDVVFAYDPHVWGFHEDHGTIIASTYGFSTNDTEIWRSTDDGLTWTKVHTIASGTRDHLHSVCYHAGLSRWVADGGDDWSGGEQITLFSDDDGVTWYNPLGEETVSATGRVTRFRDYGHATRILIGSDHHLRVGWFDLSTLETGTFCRFQSSWDHAYAFDLFQHNGVWYWCSSDSDSGSGNAPIIRVSLDLVHWVTYWRPTRTDIKHVYQFCGEVGGKLHFRLSDASAQAYDLDEHLILDPAKVVQRTGVIVSPAKTNLLGDRPSKCDLLTDWGLEPNGSKYDTAEVDTSTIFAPGAVGSLHFVKTERPFNEYTGITAVADTPVEIGHRYQAHAWVKGKGFYVNTECVTDQGAATWVMYGINEDEWTEIWGAPYTAADTATKFRVLLTQDQADYLSELWIGAAEIVECPTLGEWSPGGVSQPADVASVELELGTHWTHVFSFMPLCDTNELTDGTPSPVYIHSWVAPDGDFVNLYYDPADSKLKMESTVDSTPTGSPIETTGTRQIDREHLFRIAVRYAAGEMSFSVCDGAGVEHVGPLTHTGDALSGEGVTLITGDETGEGVMHGVLLDDYVLPLCLSDEHVAKIFGNPGNFESAFTPETALQLV